MNKFLTKIAGVVASIAMVIGVGVGVANKQAKGAYADPNTYTIGWGSAIGTSGTYTNFTDTSGNVPDILSFSTAKNGASAPAYNSSSKELRLYYNAQGNGGSITIVPATGITFTGFVMETSTTPSVKYTVDGGSATAVSQSNNKYTVTGISASASLKIQNVNTSNTQLRIKTIELSYTAPTKTLSSIALSGTYPTTFYQGDAFSHEGMIVTATYDNDSHKDVTDDVTFSGYNMSETGEQTVTVSYTENEVTKTATYDITVNEISVVTFTAGTDVGTSSSQSADTITKNGISMYCSSIHDTDNAYRYYKDSTVRFSSATRRIVRIEFTGNDNSNKISNIGSESVGTLQTNSTNNTAVWTGNSTMVEFTMSAQGRASVVTVTLLPTAPTLELSTDSVSMKTNETAGKQVSATVYNVNDPTFVWTPSDSKTTVEVISTIENTQTVAIKPNSLVAAETSVTLTISGTTLSSTINVYIVVPLPGETAGTAFTVAQARAHIDEVVVGGNASGNDGNSYYAAGTVSEIVTPLNPQHGNITYNISTDGLTTSSQLQVYRGKDVGGANFDDEDDIRVGDQVVVYGRLKKYNDTYEFDEGGELVSLIAAPRVNSISLTPSNIIVEPNAIGQVTDLFTNIAINQDDGSNKTVNDIVWTSDDENVFYIDGNNYLASNTHRAHTEIHASIGGKEYGSATVEIVDPNIYSISYNVPQEWKLVSNPASLKAGDRVILTAIKEGTTYAAGTYSSGNNVPADTTHTLTVNGDIITGVVSSMIYTLEEGSVENSVAFKDSTGKYLYAASSSSNNMKTQAEIDANASFIIDSDGNVVAQGSNERNNLRYNKDNNIFSCYASNSSVKDLVTFYKLKGGAGTIDLSSVASYATLQARETGEGNDLVVDQVSMRFGATISKADWDLLDDTLGITDYGVMLFRTTEENLSVVSTVEEYFRADPSNVTIVNKGNGTAPSLENNSYEFSVQVNVTSTSKFNRYYCAAPFIVAGGEYYFLNEIRESVRHMANNYTGQDISTEALLYLATAN